MATAVCVALCGSIPMMMVMEYLSFVKADVVRHDGHS
jgi:hypothetical protein